MKVWCGSIQGYGIVQRPISVSGSKGKGEGIKLTTMMSVFECCLTMLVLSVPSLSSLSVKEGVEGEGKGEAYHDEDAFDEHTA